jgi:hypothetical protein
MRTFQAGGAFTRETAQTYIQRQADVEVMQALCEKHYILLIEPRQQGKTSLINMLDAKIEESFRLIYLDVTTLDRSSITSFYTSLSGRIIQQLDDYLLAPDIVISSSTEFRELLKTAARYAFKSRQIIVLIFDEIGAINFEDSTNFFSVLREIFNSRQIEPIWEWITVILAGAFHPRDLITDTSISPFNIAHRIRLHDFELSEVEELVSKGDWEVNQVRVIAERVYYWTKGQPYISQALCKLLDKYANGASVDEAVKRFRLEDENHLPAILRLLEEDKDAFNYTKKILRGKKISFFPAADRIQSQLELLGVISGNEVGNCIIRNKLYIMALQAFYASHSLKEKVQKSNTSDAKSNKKSRVWLVLPLLSSILLSFVMSFFESLAATYLAPSLMDKPWLAYVALIGTFIISLPITIYLFLKDK